MSRAIVSAAVLVALACCVPVARAGGAAEELDKPRIMILPEFDKDMLGPVEPRAMAAAGAPALGLKPLEGEPAKCFELVKTLLMRTLVKQRYDVIDAKVSNETAAIYTRLREFRDPGTASKDVDSVAQQIAYRYNADVILFYKLLIHEEAADKDAPKVKTVQDSVQVRLVRADTGRVLAMDERTAKGISEGDVYLAHRMAIERTLFSGKGDDKGLADYVVKEMEAWWDLYRKNGRPVTVNFYIQGEDATRLQQLAALLKGGAGAQIVGPARSRRVINSEQTKEIFAEYEVSFLGTLSSLQAALVQNAAALELAGGLKLADKYRITVDAFGDHLTVCLLDPDRQEIRPWKGVMAGGQIGAQVGGAPQEVAAAGRKATVLVRTYTVKDDKLVPIGHGSGVIVSAEGLIVTNFHVVNGGSRYFVEFEPPTQGTASPQFECELFKSAPEPDLAVLKMKLQKPADAGLTALPLGRSADLRVGDAVCAIGAPFSAELINNVSFGTVSALARTERKYIVHTAPTYAGSSGGPLLSMKGEIVGIHAAGLTGEVRTPAGETAGQAFMPGFGLAIPAELVAELLK